MIYKQLWRKLHLNPILRAWAVNMKRLCQVSLMLMRPAFCYKLGHDLGGLLHPCQQHDDSLGHDLGGLLGNIILAAANRYDSTLRFLRCL